MATLPEVPGIPQLTDLDPRWVQAVAQVSAKAHAALADLGPALTGRLERATALATREACTKQPDASWLVLSDDDPPEAYRVVGQTCSCKDFTLRQAPDGWCKHRLAVSIQKRVTLQLFKEAEEEGRSSIDAQVREVLDHPPPPPGVPHEAPMAAGAGPGADVSEPSESASLLVTHARIERSPQVGALMQALARAQLAMKNPGFDSTNPHFRTRYASLAAVRDAVLPALNAEDLAVTQLPLTPQPGWVSVTTGLWHKSGQYLCTTLSLPVPKADPQGYGTALTYARRYALQAMACVAGDEDDDAESLRNNGTQSRK